MEAPELVYKFTPEEAEAVRRRYEKFIEFCAAIAEIHQIRDIILSPDMSGFIRPVDEKREPGQK